MRGYLAISLLFASIGGCSDTRQAPLKTHAFRAPTDVLRDGRFNVDVMELAAPRRFVELGERMQEGIAKNPGWAMDALRNSKPGKPLAYDPRIGLSKPEYEEFLALGKRMVARKKAEASLTITHKAGDIYALDGGQSLAELTGIEIDLKNNLVRTPRGIAKDRSEIHADERSALGRWNGIQWGSDDDLMTAFSNGMVKLSIGMIEASGRGVIYYDAKEISLSGTANVSTIVEFELPEE